MKRRDFLTCLPPAGLAIGMTGTTAKNPIRIPDDSQDRQKSTLEKVTLAMLTMQRATWEQGVAMQALLESGKTELVVLMAKEAVLRQSQDGRLAMLGEEFALSDAASPGEAVLWAAKQTGDQALMDGFHKVLDYVMHKAPRNKEGIIYHFTNLPQIEGVRKYLWNADKKLLSHMWDCEKQEFPRKDCWGVGNGWSAAGIARVIRALPDSMEAGKDRLRGYATDIIDGCLAHMRDDGLFHNIVDDPRSFVETNLAQMIAYSIYRGILGGWLDKRYKEKADRARSAAHSKVDGLGLVQGVCGSPEFDHPGTATEGQAFFILMEVAHNDLNK
jgi:unsaturated rhamnogalacturonyl hydrolase